MKENKEKNKLRRWGRVLIVLAILALVIGVVKAKASGTDADQVLTIAEQGFEGHYYDAGEREKAVITFSGSEGGSSASDTMAWYYKQNGVSALGVTLFAGEETGEYLDRVPLEYAENAVAWLKAQGYEKIAVDGISKGSEYALLAASMFPEISCVVARVPSYFAAQLWGVQHPLLQHGERRDGGIDHPRGKHPGPDPPHFHRIGYGLAFGGAGRADREPPGGAQFFLRSKKSYL